MKQNVLFDDQIILITGASGFIGSGVVRYLNDKGFSNLVIVDDVKNEKWKNLVGKSFYEIIPKEKVFDFLKGKEQEVEAIIHLGACSDTTCPDADYLLENNYRFSVSLAEYALTNDQRFIYASSAATYGDGSLGFSDDENKLEELRPINMYAYSKQLFDLWAKREKVLDKIVGLKYFNVFGPNEYYKGKMASMIFQMINKVRSEKVVKLFKSNDPENFKDGEQQRDFIYVKDAVKMTCMLLEDSFRDVSGIFNIGSGIASSWNDLAKYLFKALNMDVNIEYIDMPKALLKQYQNYTCADMTKFNSLHKEKLELISLEDSVKDYVQNYLLEDGQVNW